MKTLEINKDPALEAANIRPVPKVFEREALLLHELEWKDGPYAIYRYHYMKTDRPEPLWKYEAVILKITDPHPKSADRRRVEALPSNSEWGKFGWSLKTREKAEEQIENIRSKRGAVIEANYYSSFDSGLENSGSVGGVSLNTSPAPSEALQA